MNSLVDHLIDTDDSFLLTTIAAIYSSQALDKFVSFVFSSSAMLGC